MAKAKGKRNRRKEKLEFVQDYLPIRDLKNGIIETTDDRYIKILEIEPINFTLRSDEEQFNIISSFASWLKISPMRLQFKSITRRADSDKHISMICEELEHEENPQCKELGEDYIGLIKDVGNREALTRRFFLIFQYEAVGRNESDDYAKIYGMLQTAEQTARAYFMQCGNSIVQSKDPDEATAEILYMFYNRRSCTDEPFSSRVDRIVVDTMAAKKKIIGMDPVPPIRMANFLAPRGIDLSHYNYVVMDGLYYSFLYIKAGGYPSRVRAGWMSSLINAGEGVDIDVHLRRENRSRTMQELGDMFDREVAETDGGRDFDLANPGGTEETVKSAPKTIQSSAAAYRDLNATLGNFYEQPKNDNAEMDELLERIASLESELESEKGKASAMDDQVALMEKSYELAAKYMGGQNNGKPEPVQAAEAYHVQKAGKNTAAPVRQVTHQVVSSLSQPMSNAEFVASFSQERNRSFNTAIGGTAVSDKNTISACVYGAQSVTDGQTVRLRLLEPMAVADRIIPRNAVVVGTAKIQGERLDIGITSLEYAGTIIPVELAVYDTDGQPGIFIPNSMEMNAVREVAANMGGNLGSSINISTNAGAQLASDLGKGLIQGTSQYIAKKMRTVKVHLKAGYRVMLYQDRN